MAVGKTRERIMETAAGMFASQGYGAVSIRDIAHAVGIRESSIYYHFKSKQDILDSIIGEFEKKAAAAADSLITSISESFLLQEARKPRLFHKKGASLSSAFLWMKTYYFGQFLFDPFSNQVMRILMMEQLHDEQIAARYVEWLFEKPYRIILQALTVFMPESEKTREENAVRFSNYLTAGIFRHLLAGELTEEKCTLFTDELLAFAEKLFGQDAVRDIIS